MRRILLVLLAVVLIGSVASAQSMAKSGQWGIQTALGVGQSTAPLIVQNVGAKFFATDDIAIRVEAGLTSYSPPGGGNSTMGYAFGAGFEYHLADMGKGNVSPYVGLGVGYGGYSVSGGTNLPANIIVQGFFGGEYFFSSNFSWAGQIGLGFQSQSNVGGTTSSASTIGTASGTMIFTWYMN